MAEEENYVITELAKENFGRIHHEICRLNNSNELINENFGEFLRRLLALVALAGEWWDYPKSPLQDSRALLFKKAQFRIIPIFKKLTQEESKYWLESYPGLSNLLVKAKTF